ncbi:hypothetical protein GCM10010393_14860 [Streptomyces gobitricini]|uniref:Uncharacterized protein n=1 Tax=Streptomyces gobitricini TaxID=68211 RepID=A0ABN3LIQ7_9ACTN
MTCAVRWDSRSTASDTTTVAANAPHSHSGTSSTPNTLTSAQVKQVGLYRGVSGIAPPAACGTGEANARQPGPSRE